jgi:hypothetical protein
MRNVNEQSGKQQTTLRGNIQVQVFSKKTGWYLTSKGIIIA